MSVRQPFPVSSGGISTLTIASTTITGGTDTRVLFDDGGVLGESAGLTYVKGTGTLSATVFSGPLTGTATTATNLSISGQTGLLSVTGLTSTNRIKTVRDAADTILELGGSYSPTGTWTNLTLVTPALGTPSAGVLTSCTGLPAASVVAGTFGTGAYVMDTKLTIPQMINTSNAITASGNAATVPVTSRINTVTNNSAATLTITMTTSGAVDGQPSIVRILDASGVTQTITWVNTENSTVTAPTTSNGSTTLPLSVGFVYNNATSLWRCVGKA